MPEKLTNSELYQLGYKQALTEMTNTLLALGYACSDNGCIYKIKPGGIGTNGGCKCNTDDRFRTFGRHYISEVKQFIRARMARIGV